MLLGSDLEMGDNSSLIFTSNTGRNGASICTLLSSSASLTDEASVQINQNYIEEGWILLSAFESYWVTQSHAEIDISGNIATNGGINGFQ